MKDGKILRILASILFLILLRLEHKIIKHKVIVS
jgi:hypothetical protein